MVLTTFWFLIIFNTSKVLASCSFPPQISHQKCYPKSTKIHNNKKIMIFVNRVLVLEVSQKPFLAFPCCMGSILFLIAMQRGNAICDFCNTSPARMRFFSLLPHVPSEKLENHENRILESCCGRVGAKDAKSKSPPKSILPMVSTIRTLFLTSAKIQWVY